MTLEQQVHNLEMRVRALEKHSHEPQEIEPRVLDALRNNPEARNAIREIIRQGR